MADNTENKCSHGLTVVIAHAITRECIPLSLITTMVSATLSMPYITTVSSTLQIITYRYRQGKHQTQTKMLRLMFTDGTSLVDSVQACQVTNIGGHLTVKIRRVPMQTGSIGSELQEPDQSNAAS